MLGEFFWTCNRKQRYLYSVIYVRFLRIWVKRSLQMRAVPVVHASYAEGWLAGHNQGWNSPCSLNLRFILTAASQLRRWNRNRGGAYLVTVKMAEFSPVLSIRDGGGRFVQPIFPRSRSGSESESELSQSLARTKIRSYGSTASVTASLGEKYIEHRVTDSDTLQGIALKYGVTVSWPHDHCRINVFIFTLTSSSKWLVLIKSITDQDQPKRHT